MAAILALTLCLLFTSGLGSAIPAKKYDDKRLETEDIAELLLPLFEKSLVSDKLAKKVYDENYIKVIPYPEEKMQKKKWGNNKLVNFDPMAKKNGNEAKALALVLSAPKRAKDYSGSFESGGPYVPYDSDTLFDSIKRNKHIKKDRITSNEDLEIGGKTPKSVITSNDGNKSEVDGETSEDNDGESGEINYGESDEEVNSGETSKDTDEETSEVHTRNNDVETSEMNSEESNEENTDISKELSLIKGISGETGEDIHSEEGNDVNYVPTDNYINYGDSSNDLNENTSEDENDEENNENFVGGKQYVNVKRIKHHRKPSDLDKHIGKKINSGETKHIEHINCDNNKGGAKMSVRKLSDMDGGLKKKTKRKHFKRNCKKQLSPQNNYDKHSRSLYKLYFQFNH